MKLKDYLHYYLYGKIWEAGVTTCTLMGIGDSYYTIKTKQGTMLTLSNQAEIKLVLRKLEDMAEAEALHIGKLAFFDRDMKYPDSDYKMKKTGITIELPSAYAVSINNDWFEKEIRIGFNTGNIWYSGGESNERVNNQPQIFHYLLTQHFDLFNLIDAGLAIDAKTIKS
jgi:hypothetical protein